ncbi:MULTISPECIES: LuxR C-terminal-related transcriptional regulator [Arthrobacter]|uniref:LuxR C-terminal-related transcriptional regulator n=2 Tax=Arthrobacter TaxID=1663 RepID=A0ABU9KRN8_9MICC|nr:LuxR C-terminal-related transcriptional regulator [Arthrobacter sp. YJM1]MDP5228538.1 LuxR C-terminal-related transcriptional regulator [Arthrobacter sp. YJM1]
MIATVGSSALLANIERVCAHGGAGRALRLKILDELRRSVAFDAFAFVLTDPITGVGASPVAEVPCLPELPRLIRLKYLTEINRWTDLPDRFVSLLAATDGEPSRSLLWRELLKQYGVVDVASAVFRDRHGCWAFLDLWRTAPGLPFTAAELARLSLVVPAVTDGLRRAQAATFVQTQAGREALRGPVVLLLSPDLDVLAETVPTFEYLRALMPSSDGQSPVPAGAYNVAAQLLAREAGVDDGTASACVHAGGGHWFTLRAARLGGPGPSADGTIAVTIEDASGADRVALFARANALTGRETELLTHLNAGKDTHDIAAQMHLSEHTIQDHLKAIFTKTGIRTRRGLLSHVRGR